LIPIWIYYLQVVNAMRKCAILYSV